MTNNSRKRIRTRPRTRTKTRRARGKNNNQELARNVAINVKHMRSDNDALE